MGLGSSPAPWLLVSDLLLRSVPLDVEAGGAEKLLSCEDRGNLLRFGNVSM